MNYRDETAWHLTNSVLPQFGGDNKAEALDEFIQQAFAYTSKQDRTPRGPPPKRKRHAIVDTTLTATATASRDSTNVDDSAPSTPRSRRHAIVDVNDRARPIPAPALVPRAPLSLASDNHSDGEDEGRGADGGGSRKADGADDDRDVVGMEVGDESDTGGEVEGGGDINMEPPNEDEIGAGERERMGEPGGEVDIRAEGGEDEHEHEQIKVINGERFRVNPYSATGELVRVDDEADAEALAYRKKAEKQMKMRFDRQFKDGGGERFYGPKIVPHDGPPPTDYVDYYFCEPADSWVPVPPGFIAVRQSEEESDDEILY